jgi:voltage-gated potassium channel
MNIKNKFRSIVEDNTTKKGKIFDYFIQVLIFVSLISYSIETIPNNSIETIFILNLIEYFTVIIFTIEYLIRIYCAEKPIKYIFSFYGIVDFLAIIPFYLSTGLDLRSLRAFRIFRVFRALKIVRYNKALKRFGIAARIVKEEVILFFIIILIFIFLVSSGIYFFENEAQPEAFKSVPHSFWWTIVTLTTVGYGDVYPVTLGGKIFTFFVLIIGVAVVTVPAGLVATALGRAREIEDEEEN